MKKTLVLLLIVFGCEKLKPESINIPDYPRLGEEFNRQVELLGNTSLSKEVWLDGKKETKVFDMDTMRWKKELSFLSEINPNKPEYVGAFAKEEMDSIVTLKLREGEKGEVKSLVYSITNDLFSNIKATIHEDKEIYSHHRDFDISFENGLINNYQITGYQKIVLKDTIRFRIRGVVKYKMN